MSNEEAIKLLVNATYSDEWQGNEDLTTAHKMAITALHNQEQKTAHWIDNSDGGRICNPFWDRYICSNCGRHSDLENYCCNCGAEMEDKYE